MGLHIVVLAQNTDQPTDNPPIIKDRLDLRDSRQQIIPRIALLFKHLFCSLVNEIVKTRWEICVHDHITVNNEVSHLVVSEKVFLIYHFSVFFLSAVTHIKKSSKETEFFLQNSVSLS